MYSTRSRFGALPGFVTLALAIAFAVASTVGCARVRGDRDQHNGPGTQPGPHGPFDPNDHTPPLPGTLGAPTRDAATGETVLSWTLPEGHDAVRHELSLTSRERGCARPIVTYPSTADTVRLAPDLPGGRFVLCLRSFDASDNGADATNQGAVELDQPVTLHYAALRGDSHENRTLVHGRIAADEVLSGSAAATRETVVAAPGSGRLIAGRTALQVDGSGAPKLAFLSVSDGLAAEAGMSLSLATPTAQGFGVQQVMALRRPEHVALEGYLALSEQGESYLAQMTKGGVQGGSELLYTASQGGRNAVAVTIERTAGQASFEGATLVYDQAGRLHVVYAREGRLFARRRAAEPESESWTAPVPVETPGCDRVAQLSAAADGGRIAVAYLCTQGEADAASCGLGIASAPSDTSETATSWHATSLAVVDPKAACLPFASARPALAVDALGRAHIAARLRRDTDGSDDASRSGYVIGYGVQAEPGSGTLTLAPIGDVDALTSFPQLGLDATGRAHALYLTSRGLFLARANEEGHLRALPVGDGTEAGLGSILELADLAVPGGRGRSHVPFGDWQR